NTQGGVNGRRIELVKRNDYGDADSAIRVANELYASDVVAVIGHSFSGPTLAASPIYNAGSRPVLQISPSASSPALSEAGAYTFRVCPSDLAHGTALARWVRGRLNLTHGAVLYANNGYGRGIRQTFVAEFTRLNGTTVSMDPFLGDPPEVAPYLERIAQNQQAQFIILAGYENDALAVLRAARVWGVEVPVLGGDGLEQVGRFGSIADSTYMTGAYFPTIDNPANRSFVARYRDRFPTGAPPNQSAAGSWDALHMLAELLRDVGTDREALRDAVAEVGGDRPAYQGLTRKIAFDPEGDLETEQVFVAMYRDGAKIVMEGQ
ncbi:MAG: branched-chain amino acid ABC transporter substrate-binding protein, partial [Gemmatimonadales bacterium]